MMLLLFFGFHLKRFFGKSRNNFFDKITKDIEEGYGPLHFQNKLMIDTENKHPGESSLLTIMGTTDKYFKKDYDDSVEAMYEIDKIGSSFLNSLRKLTKKEPDWIGTNYNFLGMKNRSENFIEGKELEEFLSSRFFQNK